MKNIMTTAWAIAKKGAATFGGSSKEYFAEALKMAWALSRKPRTKTITWTNAKGTAVALEWATEKEVQVTNLFEEVVTVIEKGFFLVSLTANGVTVKTKTVRRKYNKHVLVTGEAVFNGKKYRAIELDMPADVSVQIFGDFATTTKTTKSNVCPKCGTHCYSDCTAS